jgi:glycosyltransferase involved in cell wall biosynthesis
MSTPLLFISDSISAQTGLARITRDISTRVHEHLGDVFRVGTAGYGAAGSRKFPFPQYTLAMDGWICPNLPEIWEDFAGDESGIVCCVWDASRLQWFSRPETCQDLVKYPDLQKFLTNPPFKKFIYAPVDASGPNDRLTYPLAQALLGFDKILAYGEFGEGVIRRTLGDDESEKRELTSLPHGIDAEVFYPRDHKKAKSFFFSLTGAATLRGEKKPLEKDEDLIGCVCTNQSRKDIALLIEAVAILSRKDKVRLWLHTDSLERCWSIPALLLDYGLFDRTVISSGHLPDNILAQAYSACDITIAPGAEGFGFPIAESLACGIPVICGGYAGGADIAPAIMQVAPVAYRYESIWSCKRPVYQAKDWADAVSEWLGQRYDYSVLPPQLEWKSNWINWENWFREGLK